MTVLCDFINLCLMLLHLFKDNWYDLIFSSITLSSAMKAVLCYTLILWIIELNSRTKWVLFVHESFRQVLLISLNDMTRINDSLMNQTSSHPVQLKQMYMFSSQKVVSGLMKAWINSTSLDYSVIVVLFFFEVKWVQFSMTNAWQQKLQTNI